MKKLFPLFLVLFYSCTKDLQDSIDNPGTKQQQQTLGVLKPPPAQFMFYPDNSVFQYCGQWDMSHKTYQIGAYFQCYFVGDAFTVFLNDEQKWSAINKITVAVDGKIVPFQNKSRWFLPHRAYNAPYASDSLHFSGFGSGAHKLVIEKAVESSQGWIQLIGIRAQSVLEFPLPARKILFFGDSYTAAWASNQDYALWDQKPFVDPYGVKSDSAHWSTQEDAYQSFASVTARELNAQRWLIAGGGYGFTRSPLPGKTIADIWDMPTLTEDLPRWNMASYQPNVVFIMLGLNDPCSDSAYWCNKYVSFVEARKITYPHAKFILAGGPKNSGCRSKDESYIQSVAKRTGASYFKFNLSVGDILGEAVGHPNIYEHSEMAAQLTAGLKVLMGW